MMLEEEFDSYLAKMQTPAARVAMQEAFEAPPDELGWAAVEHARKEAWHDLPAALSSIVGKLRYQGEFGSPELIYNEHLNLSRQAEN